MRRVTRMRWAGQLLIVLALSSLGCARGDWINETLTLADVTGTWEGQFHFRGLGGGSVRPIRFVLQQNGQRVRGEVQGPDGAPIGTFEGRVNGEVLSWQMSGQWKLPSGSSPSASYSGETTANGDELSGSADGYLCPCPFLLRRVGTQAIREKPQM